jgi:hypothetical protein
MPYLEVLRWNFGSDSGHLEAEFCLVALFTQYIPGISPCYSPRHLPSTPSQFIIILPMNAVQWIWQQASLNSIMITVFTSYYGQKTDVNAYFNTLGVTIFGMCHFEMYTTHVLTANFHALLQTYWE